MAAPQVEIASSSPFGCKKQILNTADTWVSRVAKDNLRNLSFTTRHRNLCNDNDDSSSLSALMSPRHSKIIDRWAATARQEKENPCSDGSSESELSTNLGASSLVRIWEKRLNQTTTSNTKSQSPVSPGKVSVESVEASSNENVEEEEQCMILQEEGDDVEADWESDKLRQGDQSCCSPESERGRVADLIKRLTIKNKMQRSVSMNDGCDDHDLCSNSVTGSSPCRERERASRTPKQVENKGFGHVTITSSPRIRGRQAFNDLLMQFESDRHRELNNLARRGAVSKFTQRGRIQSLIRLRLLQRGVAIFGLTCKKSAASEMNRQQGSEITQLRERFNTGDEPRTSTPAEVSNPKGSGREIVSNITQSDNFPSTDQLIKYTHCKEVTKILVSKTREDNKEETHPSLDVTFQGTFIEAQNDDHEENVDASSSSSMDDSNANEVANQVEASDQQYTIDETSYDEIIEEEEASEQNYDETSYDWISPISRPKSYWEELRQEWYKEMLDFGSDNDEIRKVLERRTVSTLLSSDFCERMDRLMKSHVGTQTQLVRSQYDEEDHEQLMAFFQERLRPREEDTRERVEEEKDMRNEDDEEEDEEEEKEEESIISGSDHELGDYSNQSSPSIHAISPSKWSYRDNDSDRVASISSPLPSQSQSFTNHPSIEMEFIYDLRSQMDQLFHEMSELRKSLKSCVDMQMQLQQSKNQEVHTVKEERKIHNRTLKKGKCCICHEKKVNAVLYRCGHMCACLKCAKELQWNNGKCPICGDPIIDVVRVLS